MDVRRRMMILGAPVAGLLVLLVALSLRRSDPPTEPVARKKARAASPNQVLQAPEPAAPPMPASDEALSRSMDEARLQSTYLNYRTAVATGNHPAQSAIKQILVRDRAVAVRMAERDIQAATTELNREIARKTFDSLRD